MSVSGETQSSLQGSATFGSGSFSATRVLANRYELHKKLGSGNFGTACLVRDTKAPSGSKEEWKVAKQMSVGEIAPDETLDAIKEGRLMSKLNHPNIVKYFDSFFDNEFFILVTEFCEGGDLKSKIADAKKKGTFFEEAVILDWFVQLMCAVEYIHNRRVLHRDLTTGNVFLKNDMIKLGDFGISRVLMGTCDMASTFTGTPYYMSPEVLKHDGYNSKSDIWSVGCILYELCTLNHAFEGQGLMGVMYKIVEGEIPKLPDRYTKDLNDIYIKILARDIRARPSATEVLQFPFMSAQIERLKAQLEACAMTTVTQKASNEQLEKEARDISKLINEPAHLEDLRRTLGFSSDQPNDTSLPELPAASADNDATVRAKPPAASATMRAEPAASTIKASPATTIKASVAVESPLNVESTEPPTSANQKAPPSASRPKVPNSAITKAATGPVITNKTPRLKTATGSKPPGSIKREQTQINVKTSNEPNPEDIAAAEAEFLRSLKQTRESGGFKATYETSDQLKSHLSAQDASLSAASRSNGDNESDAINAAEEEEYRQAKEAEKTFGISNLSPKQQMVLRKKSEADRKAHALKQVTQETYLSQRAVKDGIREVMQGGSNARKSIILSPDEPQQLLTNNNNPNASPEYEEESEAIPQQSSQMRQRRRFLGDGDLLSRSVAPVRDDRPITPMKKDVYKEASKELEFQNGIPVNPQVADFYYSYYDEFEDSEDSPSRQNVVVHHSQSSFQRQGPSNSSNQARIAALSTYAANPSKNQRIRFVSQDGQMDIPLRHEDERTELANYMATVLTRPSMASRSMTFVDEDTSQAYGPQARQTKIKVMRNNCERKLGPVKFRQVYDYLKEARSSSSNNNDNNEQRISNDLRRMLGNPHDAFLVDQLLFLETMQHS